MNLKTPHTPTLKKPGPSSPPPILLAGGTLVADIAANGDVATADDVGHEIKAGSESRLVGRDLDLDDDPNGTLADAHVAIRQVADDDARRIANGERRIERRNYQFQHALYDYVAERVRLERQQCELLLRLEERIPYGQRVTWQRELADSLSTRLGYKCAVGSIRRRITVARKGKTDPSVWDAAALMLQAQGGKLNFRKVLKALDSQALPENHEAVLAEIEEEVAPTPKAAVPSAPVETPVETVAVPLDELAQLREDASDVQTADAVLDVLGLEDSQDPIAAAKALREENERLRAENQELRAEIARLRQGAN